MVKKVEHIKLQIKAGEANPTPPVGPALGARGVNIMAFCKEFNAKTQSLPNIEKGTPVPVIVTVYGDRTFSFVVKTPPASILLKKMMNISKGSSMPNKVKVGMITRAKLEEIAEIKKLDLTAASQEAAIRTIIGTAISMGLNIEELT